MGNYPTITEVCEVTARVYERESSTWTIHSTKIKVSGEEVRMGVKVNGGISRAAANCRCIAAHIIAKHVPVHSEADMRTALLTTVQLSKHMGAVHEVNMHKRLSRACKLIARIEFGCIYYAALQELLEKGYNLWSLPKDLIQPQRA